MAAINHTSCFRQINKNWDYTCQVTTHFLGGRQKNFNSGAQDSQGKSASAQDIAQRTRSCSSNCVLMSLRKSLLHFCRILDRNLSPKKKKSTISHSKPKHQIRRLKWNFQKSSVILQWISCKCTTAIFCGTTEWPTSDVARLHPLKD